MRALITRPQEDAADLAAALTARGIEPLVEPLLQIKRIEGAKVDLDNVQALLFTSANGVRAFAALSGNRDLPAYTVGDGSAAAAAAAGFSHIESAGGDVNALASLAGDRLKPQDGVLFHAAGSVTAGDLATTLEQAGFTVRRVPLYQAEAATSLSPATRMNLTLGGIDLILLFSPRTAATFGALWRQAGSPNLDRVCAICLSAAVAREVGELPWRDVFIAERPDLPSLLALVDAELQRKDEVMSDTATVGSEPARSETTSTTAGDVRGDTAASAAATMRPMTDAPRAAGGGFGRLVTTAVVAAVVSGAVVVTAPRWQPLLGATGLTPGGTNQANDAIAGLQHDVAQITETQGSLAAKADISAALTPLQDDIAKLKTQLAQLPQATGSAGTATVDLTPLNDKVASLETGLADIQAKLKASADAAANPAPATPIAAGPDLSPEVSALKIQNDTLRDQLAALGGKIDSLSKDDLGKVGETLGAITQRLATVEAQVAAAPAPVTAHQQLATATVLSIGQLQSLFSGTQSFAGELTALKQISASDGKLAGDLNPVIDKLTPIASTGAPTLSQLQATLPVTEIARAAEAEQAASIAEDTSWWRRMTHRLAEIITVRPVGDDVTGDGPLERLARAEAALKRGDLNKTVDEVAALTGEPARRAAPWLAQAQARQTLDWAAARLAEIAARQLVPAASTSN
jgi:uroporphyrinogen-III synthase